MNPVSLADLGDFVFKIAQAYEGYLYFAFTLMMAAALLVLTKQLLVGGKV